MQANSPSERFPSLAETLREIGMIVAVFLGLAVALNAALLAG